VAHRLLRLWWFVRRPDTRGVKCLVRDGDRVLFVRHTYGDREAWELPGGILGRDEVPDDAVRREMREELGVELDGLRELGRIEVSGQNKQTLLICFEAQPASAPLRFARAEIAEARWARPEAPPRPLGDDAATLLRLAGARP
jgi:ADP-ribose pyrophosphatase YjhB (NUDIX family)